MKIAYNRLDRQYLNYRDEYIKKAIEVLDSGNYVLGNEVKEFEKEFAAYNNVKECVGVANGLDALTLAFEALSIKQGDEVIVPANTFIATIMGISKNGATPVFVEPDEYYNLDVTKIEAAITEKTKAICVVHLYGQIANMPVIMEIAKKHHLYVVEDAAQAHGASILGKKAGSWGDIGCFSFYPTKNCGGFGDGGAIITNNTCIAEEIRMMRNYGSKVTYQFEKVGYNSRLDEIQAGLLRIKLQHLEELSAERKAIAKLYRQQIHNPKISLPKVQFDEESHIYHLYVVQVDCREKFVSYCDSLGIETKIHYPEPPHLSQAYAYMNMKEGSLPICEEMTKHIVTLPIYNGMTKEEIAYLIESCNQY